VRDEISANEETLKRDIRETVEGLSGVNLADIDDLHKAEQVLEKRLPGVAERLEQPAAREAARELRALTEVALASPALVATASGVVDQFKDATLAQLVLYLKLRAALHALRKLAVSRESLALFQGLSPGHADALKSFTHDFEKLRMPVFGYLFRGRSLAALHARFGRALPCKDPRNLHRRLSDLRAAHQALSEIGETFRQLNLPLAEAPGIYDKLSGGAVVREDVHSIARALEKAETLLGGEASGVKTKEFAGLVDLLGVLREAGRYGAHWHALNQRMESLPEFDAVSTRASLEQLHTQRMAEQIDGRFLDFVDSAHATAKSLGAVIRAKQKFPTENFDHLRNAFPCIIAGIREFAEYIPLKPDTFDVVIIDEASQVSVAQALPALLRAKKVVVMGDPKQFSNVKSATASNEMNNAWLSDIRAYFERDISQAADKLQRLSQFDVKKSILEFFELVANYRIMLKKHFRGYQELISFSSKYFYGNALQAIKVRGKPLDEVIVFTELAWDQRPEPYRNVNSMEVEAIGVYLDEHLEEPDPPSVGIVTPFREQQALLTHELFKSKNGQIYEDRLKLKIMTFDTCQGEERDIIYYSLVATPQTDRLNYIFPVDLDNAGDRVEEALKMQRLNVGFSRAKEAIHFVFSKPVEQFRGSMARALQHYVGILETGEPDAEAVDPASPMETKLLDWLMKTPFVQANRDAIEVTPQFPVGDYLRQLDPYYQHPAYRADFLLQYRTQEGLINVIIEYDGFQEHFRDHGKIHEGNYDRYYRPEDIERQMVLESYGYKFLRVNRFNLGRDPVTVLSKRLYDLVKTARNVVAGTVEAIQVQARSLADGTSKPCQRCHQIKLIEKFFDAKLKNGTGGYGRICTECKTPEPAAPKLGRRRSSYRKWRRRYR
jgi:very-short-patch-repair endonuclease